MSHFGKVLHGEVEVGRTTWRASLATREVVERERH